MTILFDSFISWEFKSYSSSQWLKTSFVGWAVLVGAWQDLGTQHPASGHLACETWMVWGSCHRWSKADVRKQILDSGVAIRISVVKFKEIPFSEQNWHPVCPCPELCVNRALERMYWGFVIKRGVSWTSQPTVGDKGKEKDEIKDAETLRRGHLRNSKTEAGLKYLRPKPGFLGATRS